MPDIHDTPAADAERTRQANAERARRYRAARREEGKPDTKAVDAAIAEAVSYLVHVTVGPASTSISVAELSEVATIILKRDGYRKIWARLAVVERMRSRPAHDMPTAMPSRRPTPTTAIIEPPARGKWTELDIELVRSLAARIP